MAKDDMIELEGVVVESLPNTMFQVKTEGGRLSKRYYLSPAGEARYLEWLREPIDFTLSLNMQRLFLLSFFKLLAFWRSFLVVSIAFCCGVCYHLGVL